MRHICRCILGKMSVYGCLAAGSGHAGFHDANTARVKFFCTVSFKEAKHAGHSEPEAETQNPRNTEWGSQTHPAESLLQTASPTSGFRTPSEPLLHRLLPALVEKMSRVRCAGRWTVTGEGGEDRG